MKQSAFATVIDRDGLRGSIELPPSGLDLNQPQTLIYLDNGEQLLVPTESLIWQDDGSYFLPISLIELISQQDQSRDVEREQNLIRVPVVAEELRVDRQRVETGKVKITKLVREHEEIIDEPIIRDEVMIDRVPINRAVDETEGIRYQGDVMIVPLYEEVLVVRKQLMLKEELHISRRLVEAREPQRVVVRSEEAKVIKVNHKEAASGK
jgi:uncharacterized protein (TIGR02271 family)